MAAAACLLATLVKIHGMCSKTGREKARKGKGKQEMKQEARRRGKGKHKKGKCRRGKGQERDRKGTAISIEPGKDREGQNTA